MKHIAYNYFKTIGLAVAMTVLCTACSGESALVSKAKAEGEAAANELIENMPMQEIDMQNRLLMVMNNEYELRRDGHPEAAEAYMNSFIETISQSDSLSTILGYEKTAD